MFRMNSKAIAVFAVGIAGVECAVKKQPKQTPKQSTPPSSTTKSSQQSSGTTTTEPENLKNNNPLLTTDNVKEFIYNAVLTTYNLSEYVVSECAQVAVENLPNHAEYTEKIPSMEALTQVSEEVLTNVTDATNKVVLPNLQQAYEVTSDAALKTVEVAKPHAEMFYNKTRKSYEDLSSIPEVQVAAETVMKSSAFEAVKKFYNNNVNVGEKVKLQFKNYQEKATKYYAETKTRVVSYSENTLYPMTEKVKAVVENHTKNSVQNAKDYSKVTFETMKKKFEEFENLVFNEKIQKALKQKIVEFEKRYPETAGKLAHSSFVDLLLTVVLMVLILYMVMSKVVIRCITNVVTPLVKCVVATVVKTVKVIFSLAHLVLVTIVLKLFILTPLRLALKLVFFIIRFPFMVLKMFFYVLTCGCCCRSRNNKTEEVVDDKNTKKNSTTTTKVPEKKNEKKQGKVNKK